MILSEAGIFVSMHRYSLRIPVFLLIPLLLFLVASCSVRQTMVLNPDSSGTLEIKGRALPFAGESLNDLAIIGGYDDASALYESALAQARIDLAGRPGVQSCTITRSDIHGWSASVYFSNIESFLGSAGEGGYVSLEENGKTSIFSLKIDRSNAGELQNLIPFLRDPALSLFNPGQTEGIGEEVYITDILGFTFGEENIPEIRLAAISMDLSLPGPVSEIVGGRQISENSVRFEIPFSHFMVPDEPIHWSVSWRRDS